MMKLASIIVILCLPLGASTRPCLALEHDNRPHPEPTLQEWHQIVEDARLRSEKFVADIRREMAASPLPRAAPEGGEIEDAHIAEQRALRDPSLKPGDIVSTSKGLVIFGGSDDGVSPVLISQLADTHRSR